MAAQRLVSQSANWNSRPIGDIDVAYSMTNLVYRLMSFFGRSGGGSSLSTMEVV
jgi:hypothetical protein